MASERSAPAAPAAVWIVEDNDLYRDSLAELINASATFRCAGAWADCEACLAALGRGDRPALLLMDIELPGMSGIEGVARIRTMAPALPVVMLTVHQSNDRIFEAICAGASGYLLKSSPREEILRAVEQALGGGAAMDAQIARRVLQMFAALAAPRADHGLSEREREVLQFLVDGLTKQQVAERLLLSPHTVDAHVRHIYAKLHVSNRSGAVAKAVRDNLVAKRMPDGGG